MKRMAVWLSTLCLLAACSAPVSRAPDSTRTPNPFDKPAATPITAGDPATPSRACKTDADCVVKDVGNCCGYYPACVARDAQVDPAAVQARCAKEGRVGVCGFPVISGCSCVQGTCQAKPAGPAS